MENDRIAIVGGVRTPFAKAFTDLTDLNASDLAKLTTQELIQRLDLPLEAIDEVIWGAVLPTMTNLNVGREVAIALGLDHAPGFTLARQCATGVQSITSAAEGDAGAIFGFPPFLGGPYWAIDRIGLTEFVIQLLRLENRHGRRFAPAPGLVDRAEAGEGYHAGA